MAVADKGIDTSERFYDELVIGGADGAPKVYKMHREKKRVIGDDSNKVRDYPAMPGRICSLAFSPDGGRFAAGSGLDGKGDVWVYNTADAKVISKMQGQPGPVYAVAFRPDGKAVASAGFDGVVRLSDPETGKVLKEFSPLPPAQTGAR